MPRLHAPLLAGLLTILPAAAGAGHGPIVIDGRFDDWKGVRVALRDPLDARDADVDVREVRLTHDEDSLYLSLRLERPANLHMLHGTLSIAFDADGDAATGRTLQGMPGTDLLLEFSPVGAQGRPLAGARALTPHAGDQWTVHSVTRAGVGFGPSFAAARIEIALPRGPLGNEVLFRNTRLRGTIAFRNENGDTREETAAFAHLLLPGTAADPHPRRDPALDPLARAPGTSLRVLSWNVNRGGFVKNPAPFARILAAVRPDVIVFDELPPESSGEHLARFLAEAMPAPAPPFVVRAAAHDPAADTCEVEAPACTTPPWNVVFGACGGRQRVAVAARESLTPVGSLRWVDYPERHVRELERVGSLASSESADQLLAQGVGTGGARLTFARHTVLAAAVDLQCCGRAAGPEDTLRVIEVSAIHDALRKALGAEKSDAVILAGDFNLVGSRVPLDIVSRNLDPDGDHLEIVDALQLDGRSNATWADANLPFAPGRLDFMLYSASSLTLRRSFVFEVADLDERWRTHHGLHADDSRTSSDHMPIVVDFMLRAR